MLYSRFMRMFASGLNFAPDAGAGAGGAGGDGAGGDGGAGGGGSIDFTPEQKAHVETIVQSRLAKAGERASTLAADLEAMQKSNTATTEQKDQLAKSLADLKASLQTAEQRAKTEAKGELNARDETIRLLEEQVGAFTQRETGRTINGALTKAAEEHGFKSDAVRHFAAVALSAIFLDTSEDEKGIPKANIIRDVNGVPTQMTVSVDEYVKEQAAAKEWEYAIDSARVGGLGAGGEGQRRSNPGTTHEGAPTNQSITQALQKEKII